MKSIDLATWLFISLVCVIAVIGCEPAVPPTPTPVPGPDEPLPNPPDEHSRYADPVKQDVWRLHAVARAQIDPQLPQLSPHTLLDAAAQRHAEWMAANNNMSHTGEAGSSFWDRAKSAGYFGRGGGENIAYGYSSPEGVVTGWMNSKGHRANILNSSWEHIGIGYAKDATNRIYWCCVFAYGGSDSVAREYADDPEVEWTPGGLESPKELEIQGVTLSATDKADSWVYKGTDVPAFFMEALGEKFLAETNEIRGDKVFRYDPWERKWIETDIDPNTVQLTLEKEDGT